MSSHEPRKVYSIEKRMQAEGVVDPGLQFAAGMESADGFSPVDLMNEIRALRADIAEMRNGGATMAGSGNGLPEADADLDRDLRIELAQMVRTIARTKTELAQIRHPDAEDDRLQDASGELDAIVMATEGATNQILEATETIEKEITQIAALAHEDEDIITLSDKIASQLTTIMEACNFQDITGQRINKVVKTMHFVEERIRAMIDIWGLQAFADLPVPTGGAMEDDPDADLLAGPQMEGQGITQDEIDKLFD
ncbi:protein phosphatase CheZ [Aestuariispira insulae]|uniref:Chemotaxis protein CheZ n=1 Tax=Aestuariispira insulae TaxID=1461337 RepID=A0A3D9HNG9_9PROT|nr:protein phosphatase CheZ [Aestuariispira insulae]RED51019.1 chemotaxis protein CheZ [Aestuariispira insulae]